MRLMQRLVVYFISLLHVHDIPRTQEKRKGSWKQASTPSSARRGNGNGNGKAAGKTNAPGVSGCQVPPE